MYKTVCIPDLDYPIKAGGSEHFVGSTQNANKKFSLFVQLFMIAKFGELLIEKL